MFSKFTSAEFLSSGTWVCPAGVTRILVYGMGGGSSGTGGSIVATTGRSAGGLCTFFVPRIITVVPNTSYSITIGAGGASAASGASSNAGTATTFAGLGSFAGATSSIAPGVTTSRTAGIFLQRTVVTAANMAAYPGQGIKDGTQSVSSYPNQAGQAVAPGTNSGSYMGATSGMSTSFGLGGQGGNADPTLGTNGANAPANSGAGGGGGGCGAIGGTGGAGGSGRMLILWVE